MAGMELADALNGCISLYRGDEVAAGLPFAATIPFAGWGATGGKLIFKYGKKIEGVYDLTTTSGKYVGQSKNIVQRISQHFYKNGKLSGQVLKDEVLHAMPGATKIEREAYEQYLIFKFQETGADILNVRNPMGGRLNQYYNIIDNVIKKYNLPK